MMRLMVFIIDILLPCWSLPNASCCSICTDEVYARAQEGRHGRQDIADLACLEGLCAACILRFEADSLPGQLCQPLCIDGLHILTVRI